MDETLPPSHQPHDAVQPIPTLLQWPTPITDTLAAYDYLRKALAPSAKPGGTPLQRRDIYVHGSYLGATLAASLALTETHPHAPVAIRGLSAYNGIYNWTTFLPDHPSNRPVLAADEMPGVDIGPERADDEDVAYLRDLMPALFGAPADLFDPFASPVLFFHTSGIMIPPSFTERWAPPNLSPGFAGAVDALAASGGKGHAGGQIDPYDYVYSDPEDLPLPPVYAEAEMAPDAAWEDLEPSDADMEAADEVAGLSDESGSSSSSAPSTDTITTTTTAAAAAAVKPLSPRKGYLTFPPRWSTLKIPDTLLLHSTAPPLPKVPSHVVDRSRRLCLWEKLRDAQNSFGTQAAGLGRLMRRSMEKFELRERMRWDEEFEDCAGEAARRVRIEDAGVAGGGNSSSSSPGDEFEFGFGKGERAEEIAAQWFEERMF